jgi:two-component system sensor histidine kinase BaeS
MAEDLAAQAGIAYREQGAWTGAQLAAVQDRADAADAHFIVVAPDGAVVYGGPVGQGFRQKAFSAPVAADGQDVGTAYLAFRDGAPQVHGGVSATWLVAATVVAGMVALLMALLLTRRLTEPLEGLTTTARAFAAGDRAARAATDAPGELGELAVTFNEMADEVTAAEASRRHLSADVAHELRTPLSALQGGLEELAAGDRPADPETLAALHRQAVHLGRIVADLAELSQAEAVGPRLEPRDVELADLVRSGLGVWQSMVEAAGQSLRTDLQDGVWVWADPDRLHQVVGNLLANAVRHCRPGDTVTVTVEAQAAWAVIAVADTGPGIPAAEVPHVFDRFWRAGDRAGTPGTGLGLPVARALVQASGGQISLESEEGVGTVVTIRLALSQ